MAERPKICVICEVCVTLFYPRDLLLSACAILDFVLREMTHDETATEAQYQNDDGEHHGSGIRPVLHILLRCTQLEKHA